MRTAAAGSQDGLTPDRLFWISANLFWLGTAVAAFRLTLPPLVLWFVPREVGAASGDGS